MTKSALGCGRFQWNAGAWFGGTLGGIAWMAVTAAFLVAEEQFYLALIPASAFVLVLAVSVGLWSQRAYMLPFKSLMVLLSLLALVIPTVWIALSASAPLTALNKMGWPQSAWATLAVLLLVPGLMAWLFALEFFAPRKTT